MTEAEMGALAGMVAQRLFALLRERSPLEAQQLAAEALGADAVSRLALADWLEESGAPSQAERLRMQPVQDGEVLVIQCGEPLSGEAGARLRDSCERLEARIRSKLGKDVLVVLMPQGLELSRLRLHGEGGEEQEEGGGS